MLVHPKGNGSPDHGVSKLCRSHLILFRLPMSELPVHVGLVEKADVRHNACSHPALTQSLDHDVVGRLTAFTAFTSES
jgi:hypothetical protein